MKNNKIVPLLNACVITTIVMALPVVGTAAGESVTSNVAVDNVAPDVCYKWEEPDDFPDDGTQVLPNTYPAAKTVTIYACVCDGNGNEDILSVRAEVNHPDGTTKVTVPLDYNSSVYCADCFCAYLEVACVGYSGTLDMDCCDPPGDYAVNVTVTDTTGVTASRGSTFEYTSLIAMTASDVNFGSVAPGGSSTAKSNVTVNGNSAIKFVDVNNSGYDVETDDGIVWSDMRTSDGNKIPDGQIISTWVPSTFIPWCLGSDDVSFTLNVSGGTPKGVYAGTITFTPSECRT